MCYPAAMRYAIYLLSAAQVLYLLAILLDVLFNDSDATSRGMGFGFFAIGLLGLAIFLGPALFLARSARWAWLGVILALTPPSLLLLYAYT